MDRSELSLSALGRMRWSQLEYTATLETRVSQNTGRVRVRIGQISGAIFPNLSALSNLNLFALFSHRWFYTHVTAQQAKELLLSKDQDGSFLVRPSQTNPGDFKLSVRYVRGLRLVKVRLLVSACGI